MMPLFGALANLRCACFCFESQRAQWCACIKCLHVRSDWIVAWTSAGVCGKNPPDGGLFEGACDPCSEGAEGFRS